MALMPDLRAAARPKNDRKAPLADTRAPAQDGLVEVLIDAQHRTASARRTPGVCAGGWRCCRGCSAMAAVPRTTRTAEARCAMPSERSPLRWTINGVQDGRRE